MDKLELMETLEALEVLVFLDSPVNLVHQEKLLACLEHSQDSFLLEG